jgi:hypothetical protein
LTLPQARLLIERTFPDPKRQLSYMLLVIEYHTRRNHQAYISHRKRRLTELKKWKSLKSHGNKPKKQKVLKTSL